jgi:hypothetical protein
MGDNPERLNSEASFAALYGASPIEYSSGRRITRRLNYGGDYQANAALHRIVFTRLRHDPAVPGCSFPQRCLNKTADEAGVLEVVGPQPSVPGRGLEPQWPARVRIRRRVSCAGGEDGNVPAPLP